MKNYVRLFGLAQTFVLFLSFSNSYAVASPNITPGMARKVGEVLRKTILPAAATGAATGAVIGAGKAFGSDEALTIENSGEPYVVSWYVQLQDGQLYRVCQNAQSGRYISEPYWCQ